MIRHLSGAGRWLCIAVFLAVFILASTTATGAPTGSLRVVKFDRDGTTVLAEKTVDYRWMEANLPVLGDGSTHYYHQGPVFSDDKETQWDTGETTNFKDRGAVKGTDVKELCSLVGGMADGDSVMIHAGDGYQVVFPYRNVYGYEPRQGPVAVCWYNGEDSPVGERQGVGYPPDYYVGMRLVFFADTSVNREGLHVFGNADMRAVMPNESIHLFENLYPSTSGYNVKWVDEVRVYTGGYHGQGGSPAKSLPGSETTAAKSSLTAIAGTGGLLGAALIFRRRG